MMKSGDALVVHGLRGRASNRRLSDETRPQTLAMLRQPDWHDFGPTFAAQRSSAVKQSSLVAAGQPMPI